MYVKCKFSYDFIQWASESFSQILAPEASSGGPHKLTAVNSVTMGPSGDVAWAIYETAETFGPRLFTGTIVLKKTIFKGPDCGIVTEADVWTVALDHRSMSGSM